MAAGSLSPGRGSDSIMGRRVETRSGDKGRVFEDAGDGLVLVYWDSGEAGLYFYDLLTPTED